MILSFLSSKQESEILLNLGAECKFGKGVREVGGAKDAVGGE